MSRRLATFFVLALAACGKDEQPLAPNLNAENRVATRSVDLFYESPAKLLVAEQRSVALPENPAAALPVVMNELLKGSANTSVPRLLPEDTVIRGAYLLPDGTAVVDLGGPTLTEGWSTGTHQELMAIQSVVQTIVANFPDARRVRLLLNGTPSDTLGGHIWLGQPFVPNASVVTKQ